MRKLVYSMMTSLDGYVEDRDGSIEWSMPADDLHSYANERAREASVFLNGRRLFEAMAGFWPTAGLDPGDPEVEVEFAEIWRETPTILVSRTIAEHEWAAEVISEGVVERVRELKQGEGGPIDCGGAELAATLLRAGLVDEITPMIQPVLLGGGKPFLPELEQRVQLDPIETIELSSGARVLRYAVRG